MMAIIGNLCPDPGLHEYKIQQGRVICAIHGRWLGKVESEWRK